MRTTISINDQLLQKARRASIERQCTLGQVVEDALRVVLEARRANASRRSFRPFKTYKGRGLQAGIDLNSNASLLDRMDN